VALAYSKHPTGCLIRVSTASTRLANTDEYIVASNATLLAIRVVGRFALNVAVFVILELSFKFYPKKPP